MLRKFTALFLCAAIFLSGAAITFAATSEPAATKPTTPIYNTPGKPVDVYKAFTKHEFKASDSTNLKYRLFVPDGYTPDSSYPVLIFLHGAGERGSDNDNQLKNAAQNLFNDLSSPIYGAIVIAPQCPNDNQWVDTPWSNGNYSVAKVPESNELKAVMELLDSIKGEYSVADNRIYAMGLSMGGFGTWDLMMRHPDVITAGIPMCGGGDLSYAKELAKKPIWTIHSADDSVVPPGGTRDMVNAIKSAGGEKITYEDLNGYGHNVWDYGSTREGLMNWLFNQVTPCETHTDKYTDNKDGTHRRVCAVCGEVIAKSEEHRAKDDGDCSTAVKCLCGAVVTEAKEHDFTGSYRSDEEGHWHICKNAGCLVKEDKQPHTGGTATADKKAVCEVCGKEYGEFASGLTKGDVDKNGAVDINDLSALKVAVMDGADGEEIIAIGDMDLTGSIDVNDMTALKAVILEPK